MDTRSPLSSQWMYWFLLLKNVQMGEMGVWRRSTDGEVFSFWLVIEQRPGIAEGVKTHRCEHRDEEWHRHMAEPAGSQCVFAGFRYTKKDSELGEARSFSTSPSCPPLGTGLSAQGWLNTHRCFQMTEASCFCSPLLKSVSPVSSPDVLSQALLWSCLGRDQLSAVASFEISFLSGARKWKYSNFTFVDSHYWKFCVVLSTNTHLWSPSFESTCWPLSYLFHPKQLFRATTWC